MMSETGVEIVSGLNFGRKLIWRGDMEEGLY